MYGLFPRFRPVGANLMPCSTPLVGYGYIPRVPYDSTPRVGYSCIPRVGRDRTLYFSFSRSRVRYCFMPSASFFSMISSRFFSSVRMLATWAGVRGLKRISCSK